VPIVTNRLDVDLSLPHEHGSQAAILRIDGRPLIELITEIERPIAAEDGQPDLAGAYGYLSAAVACLPSRHLLGQTAECPSPEDRKSSVLECDCGIAGCWPLLVRITVAETEVIWSDFEQPHRSHWTYPSSLRFVFDRRQYEAALERPATPG
jgi:hypothetical protein